MEEIKQETIQNVCVDDYKRATGIEVQSNNYASCYAIPLLETKGHNGPHKLILVRSKTHIGKK